MAILFDWFETPGTQVGRKRTLHARPCFNGTSNMKSIAKHIQTHCSLTVGDIMAVLSELKLFLWDIFHCRSFQKTLPVIF